jgi:orotidine-5'-phosphate decarboxylase
VTAPDHFADRLLARIDCLGHPLCVGLDPHLGLIPASFRRGSMKPGDPATAAAVEHFLGEVVDRVAGRVSAIKPQAAFFEELGPAGFAVLARLMQRARDRELVVVLDAKRGDIGSTAAAYASAYLAVDAVMPADALTVNPYLGLDTIEPFAAAAAPAGRGLFVLVKTSNPGSRDLQELSLGDALVYEHLADGLAPLARRLEGRSGFSSLGIVAGATFPEEAKRIRERLPSALMLVPGYGAQGASAAEAVAGFTRPHGRLLGGLVNASRSILFAGEPWEEAFEAALTRSIEELGAATS